MKEENIQRIGWFASITAIIMFSSYVDQIILNIEGQTGSIILPIATTINCSAWVCYALVKQKRDWPIFTCNIMGVFAGAVTAITGIVYQL
jgi:uncharacterized protein with PQ loop repeat